MSDNLGSQSATDSADMQSRWNKSTSVENSAQQDVVYPFIRQICFDFDFRQTDRVPFEGFRPLPATNIASGENDKNKVVGSLYYATALIKAVQALHDQAHLLHCDIKPANVRWKDGAIKLIDFGHAQQMEDATWSPGTKGFEAPEIYQQQLPNSTETDAYSVGQTILFELKKLKKEEQKVHDGDEVEQETIFALLKKVAENLVNAESSARWSLNEASKELDNFHKQKNKQRPRELGMPFPPKKFPKLAIKPLLQDAKPFHPLKCNHK